MSALARASKPLEGARIVLLVLGAALLYGVCLDQLTVRVSPAYFTVAHPTIVDTGSPTLLAVAWGARASAPVGLGLGALLALASRAGRRAPVVAAQLVGPVVRVIAACAGTAMLGAGAGALAVQAGWLRLPEPIAGSAGPDGHARFFTVYGATLASYAMGICAGLGLCASTWSSRQRDETRSPAPRDRIGPALFYGSLGGIVLVLAVPLAIAWTATTVMMRPPFYEYPGVGHALAAGGLRDPQREYGLGYEDVTFATSGGALLRGWLLPAEPLRDRQAAVVLAGGGWSDRRSLLPLAPMLHEAGFTVLAFDYRDRVAADGTGRGASFGLRESEDVSAAARFLTERGFERIAVVGYSMGGTAAILAAAEDPRVDAVVASTPGTDLRDLLATAPETAHAPQWLRDLIARVLLLRIGAPLAAVTSLEAGPIYAIDRLAPRPLLLLHGRNDPVNSVADARRLLARARPPRQLFVVDGAAHLDVLEEPSGEVVGRILAFLEQALGKSGS